MIMLKKKLGNPECPGFTFVYNVINYNMTLKNTYVKYFINIAPGQKRDLPPVSQTLTKTRRVSLYCLVQSYGVTDLSQKVIA